MSYFIDIDSKYNKLYPIYVGDRGWSLSRHPGNHGKFLFQGLCEKDYEKITKWVDQQQNYIQSLSLEIKAGIMLWKRYSRAYNEEMTTNSLLTERDEKLEELFEMIPNQNTIERYKYLVQHSILHSPIIPIHTITYTTWGSNTSIKIGQALKSKSFIEASFLEPKNPDKSRDLIVILLDKYTSCIYMDSGFGTGNKILLPIGTQLIVEDINIKNNEWSTIIKARAIFEKSNYDQPPDNFFKSDDTIFFENARKETLEETGIDINNSGKIIDTIDFPLHKQKEYCSSYLHDAYLLVPTSHGAAASGTLFICPEDRTILLFQRSFQGDFGGTWAGVGGAIGEDRAPVYKTKFTFRTYIIEISLNTKRLWKAKKLPRINYEHLTYSWFKFDDILTQLKDFGDFNEYQETERVTNFLRAYTSQIPIASNTLDIRAKILKYGKFAIYLKNRHTHIYELVLPGAAYTLWKAQKHLH